MTEWLTAEQAAEQLGLSILEARRKFRKGIIPAERFGRGPWKVKPSEIEKYLKNPVPKGNPKISEQKIWELASNRGNLELFKLSPNWAKSKRMKRKTKKEKT